MLAAINGKTEIVKLLLTRPDIDINAKDNNGDTPLMLAAINGKTEIVKLLLTRPDIDINAKDNNGDTPLMLAAINGKPKIVELLLARRDIDINAKDGTGSTAIELAASTTKCDNSTGDIDRTSQATTRCTSEDKKNTVEALLDSPDIDIKNIKNKKKIAEFGTSKIHTILIRLEENIKNQPSDSYGSANTIETYQNNIEEDISELKHFLSLKGSSYLFTDKFNGIQVKKQAIVIENKIRKMDKRTEVYLTAELKKRILDVLDMVKTKNDTTRKIFRSVSRGKTIKQRIYDDNVNELVRLIKRSSDENKQKIINLIKTMKKTPPKNINATHDGNTLFSLAVQTNKLEIVTSLLDVPGIDINSKNTDGQTAITTAVRTEKPNIEIIELLIQKKINSNYKDKDGQTPFMYAMLHCDNKIIELFIEEAKKNQQFINSKDKNGLTALLMFTAKAVGAKAGYTQFKDCKPNEYITIFEKLRQIPGIDVNCKDLNENTPLMIAVKNSNVDAVEALLKFNNIKVNAKNNLGLTALMMAVPSANTDTNKSMQMKIIDILLKAPEINKGLKNNNGKTFEDLMRDRNISKIDESISTTAVTASAEEASAEEASAEEAAPLDDTRPLGQSRNETDETKINQAGEKLWNAANQGEIKTMNPILDEWSGNEHVLNWKIPGNKSSPLITACINNKVECVKSLLTTPGVDINMGDINNLTGLFWAAIKGHLNVVNLLIEREGIDLNKAPTSGILNGQELRGKTPLKIASEYLDTNRNGQAVVNALTKKGARMTGGRKKKTKKQLFKINKIKSKRYYK